MDDRHLTLDKLRRRLEELDLYRLTQMADLSPLAAMEDDSSPDAVHIAAPETVTGGQVSVGDDFRGRDRYLWVRKAVQVPEAKPGLAPVAVFDFGRTGGGNNAGFEAMLFVDRQIHCGVDSNHTQVDLTAFSGQAIELTLMLWTGLEGGGPHREQRHLVKQAHLGYRHEAADRLYYLSRAALEAAALLSPEAPERYVLIRAVDGAMALINWDADKCLPSIEKAWALLDETVGQMEKRSGVTVRCVGHTHIDVAWLWRLKHTREKAMRSFSTVLRLMEQFGEYTFLQAQPQLYQYIRQDAPALYQGIKAAVAQGRWEPDGGMWLEADCNISSGESLTRQLLYGMAFFQREFGHTCRYLWLPDVFGYSWALPQILKLCGLETFVTTKISWNQYNTMPDDLFRWRGIDGTEVLTYFITTPDPGKAIDDRFATYNGRMDPRTVLGSWLKFRNKAIANETLVSYGFGDGGGGVNRDMLMMRRAMDRLPGLPHVRTSTAGAFLEGIHQAAAQKADLLHTWDGELYLEYHRGTYTTQAANKRWNRYLEFKLVQVEWLSCLAQRAGVPYDSAAIGKAWETVLRNQFHDIIPGSSIREVYQDSEVEYAQANATLDGVIDRATGALLTQAPGWFTLAHFGSFARQDLVTLPAAGAGTFYTEEGKALAAQPTQGGYDVLVSTQPLSLTSIRFAPGESTLVPAAFAVDLGASQVETPYYQIAWNSLGQITRLYDRENRREVLAQGKLGNALEVFEDKPLAHDAWDIDTFYDQKREHFALSAPVELVVCGPLKAVLRFHFAYNQSTLQQDMVLYAHSPRIDFVTQADWHETQRLLKVAFDTSVRTTKATYDIQYGHAERPTHANTSWDWARFEVVGHKWADMSEANYGVSLLNNCKYGYSAKDSTLKLSLLRSSKHPDTHADMGMHHFIYALLPHEGNLGQANTIQQATALNLPLAVQPGRALDSRRLAWVDTSGVVVDALKQSEAGGCLVLRTHECLGGTQRGRVCSELGTVTLTPCNLLEQPLGEALAAGAEITWRPFEIKTFRVKWEG